jgi:hypothetical protein
MLKIFSEQHYAACNVIKTINYAIMKNPINCSEFIQLSGLKYIYSILIGKGMKKDVLKRYRKDSSYEECIISILSQLMIQFYISFTNLSPKISPVGGTTGGTTSFTVTSGKPFLLTTFILSFNFISPDTLCPSLIKRIRINRKN